MSSYFNNLQKSSEMRQKLCVVLIKADIFNKAVQGNILKPLRNLYTKHCGELAWIEEHLALKTLTSLLTVSATCMVM